MWVRQTRRVALNVLLAFLSVSGSEIRAQSFSQPAAGHYEPGVSLLEPGRAVYSAIGESTPFGTEPLSMKLSSEFEWSQTPTADLSRPGAKTVILAACPAGVKGKDLVYTGGPSTNPSYYVYISGTGSPESALVTGGTCAGDGNPGTLTFTTVNVHAAGYTISSATAGIQEASIAAKLDIQSGTGAHYYQDGYVRVPPGIHDLHAPLTIVANHQTIDFSGAVLRCDFDASCINVGRSDNYTATSNVTLIKPRAIPTVTGSTASMIVVYGQKTRIYNAMSMIGPPNSGGYGSFGHMVTVVGDQAFLLDGLDTTAGAPLFCNRSFCGSYVYAPGPFSGHGSWGTAPKAGDNAAVGWLKHMQVAPMCGGNGVDWQSGNTLHIEDSVIQGYAQFGVRWAMNGGYGSAVLDDVYEEGGCASNPLGNVGYAGLIVEGGRVAIHGGEMPYGVYPTFANQSGGIANYYYVVATDGVNRSSNLLYAGGATLNGTGKVTITIPDIPSAVKFDLLKTTTMYQAPYGTGNWGVSTGVTRASACSNGACTFTDTQAAPTSYSVQQGAPAYFPKLDYWPGPLVIGPYAAGNSAAALGTVSLETNNLNWIAIWQTNAGGSLLDSVDSNRCILMPGSPIWEACTGQDQDLAAMLLHGKTSPQTNLKGRLNLMTSSTGPSHFITLFDSNLNKTLGAATNRPSNDTNDTYIGYDANNGRAASIGLSFGAPTSISNYIGNVGDGRNWEERLTATAKTFTVPVSAPGFQIGGSYGTNGQCLKSTGSGSAWGSCTSESRSAGLVKGTIVLTSSSIKPGQCAPVMSVPAPGASNYSVVHWSFGSDPYGVEGYPGSHSGAVLQIYAFVTGQAVAFRQCNNGTQPVTPGAVKVNWGIL
jgi:hypothetical protein